MAVGPRSTEQSIYVGDIVYDLTAITEVRDAMIKGNRDVGEFSPVRRGLRRAANRLLEFLRRRYISLAASPRDPEWPPISDEWIEYKWKHGWDTDALIMGGQLWQGMTVEELPGAGNPRQSRGFDVGYTPSTWGKDHPRFIGSVGMLAHLLQVTGIGRLRKTWQIIVGPDYSTLQVMTAEIQRGINVLVRAANRKAEQRAERRRNKGG